MGALTLKLAFAGIRSRRVPSLLSVLVVGAVATALTIGLAVRAVADRPFERTFAATNGAHVTIESAPPGRARGDRAEAGRGRVHGRVPMA